MQSKKNNVHSSETLLHNAVDKDFQQLFKPLHILTIVFCLRKYKLHDNFVTPITKRDLISCVLALIIVYILFFFTLKYFATIYVIPTVYIMYFVTYLQYAINYTILSLLNIFEGELNVDILLNLCSINKSLRNSHDSKKVRVLVWFATSVLIVAYFILISMKLWLDPLWNWSRVIFITLTLIFDQELIYIIFIIYFLACKVDTWRRTLKIKRRNSEEKKKNVTVEKDLKQLFSIYEMILNTLDLTKKASRYVIWFHFVIAFTQALSYIEIQILWSKTQTVDSVVISSNMFGVILWVLKSLLAETALCASCEVLYRRLSAAQVEVILYFACCPSYIVRRFKKNIFRLNDTRLSKLSPWGIFSVDAGLPLRMGAFLANYIIVLLQFAFL